MKWTNSYRSFGLKTKRSTGLKTIEHKQLIYRNHYTSPEQLRSDPDDYVWRSDNQRLHSTLAYRSPKEFTEQGLVL